MKNFKQNFLVASTLIRRDLKVIMANRFKGDLVNTCITIFTFNFVFGFLGPLMGIDKDLLAATFLGTFVGVVLFICFTRSVNDLADFTYGKFIDYRRILPISNRWFLTAHVASYTIHSLIATLPILVIGKIFLGSRLNLTHASWSLFMTTYLGVLFFLAVFFLCLIFTVSFDWFKFNIWQRVLTPMHLLGCMFYPWKKAYLFSPTFAQVLLLNPMTYCVEGLRSSLLGSANYLSSTLCLFMITLFNFVSFFFLLTYILNKLDWVRGHYE